MIILSMTYALLGNMRDVLIENGAFKNLKILLNLLTNIKKILFYYSFDCDFFSEM